MAGLLCVFTRPPVAGSAKTRLAAGVGANRAAALATAFLQDTWALARSIPWARCVLASTTERAAVLCLGPNVEVWPQGSGDLGERLERVLSRGLEAADFALLIGSDSPGLPPDRLEQARRALTEADAVLGPAVDGGFYLVGLRRCPRGLFADLPWSAPVTYEATRQRFAARSLVTRSLDPWFDVDVEADLQRLRAVLERGDAVAPATAALLVEDRVSGCLRTASRAPEREPRART